MSNYQLCVLLKKYFSGTSITCNTVLLRSFLAHAYHDITGVNVVSDKIKTCVLFKSEGRRVDMA
jgi:hypothetical protein